MSERYDVAIIGASLAGSSLAIRLAQKGLKVALIDGVNFPRRKSCGEGLSQAGYSCVKELLCLEELRALPHRNLCGYQVKNSIGTLNIEAPDGHVVGISRFILDHAFLRAAQALPSVQVFLESPVKEVQTDNEHSLKLADRSMKATHVVYACGSGSKLLAGVPSRSAGWPRFGLSSVWHGQIDVPLNRVLIMLKDGFELFVTPIGEECYNVSLLARKNLASPLNCDAAVAEAYQALSQLGFKGEMVQKLLGRATVHSIKRVPFFKGCFLVGDACEQFDPVGGMGMTHALLSSALLAEILPQALSHSYPVSDLVRLYSDSREALARPMRGFTRGIFGALIPARRLTFTLPTLSRQVGAHLSSAFYSNRSLSSTLSKLTLALLGTDL